MKGKEAPSRYRALVVKESKGDDGLYAAVLEQFPLTKPAPGEATVRVIAASLNRRTLDMFFVKIVVEYVLNFFIFIKEITGFELGYIQDCDLIRLLVLMQQRLLKLWAMIRMQNGSDNP